MKTTLDDLKFAISNVLINALDMSLLAEHPGELYEIKGDLLRQLQTEYNIHFTEPKDQQLSVIPDK